MNYLKGIFYSLPVQLLFLHFRKYQILLLFWALLFATVSGSFMKTFGADALFLAPEYLGAVNALSAGIMGAAIGVFIMSWNITTFVLFSRHFTFLAATTYPFLKYCINNSIIPLSFLTFFLFKSYSHAHYKELIPNVEFLVLILGFLFGLLLVLIVSFFYFFTADKTILRRMQPLFNDPKHYVRRRRGQQPDYHATSALIRPEWFLDSFFSVRRCRDVSHYTQAFLETIFKRHHFAAVLSILIAFLFLVTSGFFLDHPFFQFPAAASITILFAIFIGVCGAFAYFLQSWSVPFLVVFLVFLNFLYNTNWIDPRNKAYGLNYSNTAERPVYSRDALQALAAPDSAEADRRNMQAILTRWKEKQLSAKPLLVVINTSGGGNRSATFTMNVLQRLDSVTTGGLMKNTFLISGASGGMIGAAYFRELYRQRLLGGSPGSRQQYIDDIAGDLLNPMFSSFVARDLFSPAQRFSVGPYSYVRDRGYSFEMKLNENTRGLMNNRLQDYRSDEAAARIPLLFIHSVITRDGKKMLISTQPTRFMMHPADTSLSSIGPDLVDFTSFFSRQNPYNLRMLTALRMNATFPVVLPNVWLPSSPVIDVMDGGLRDNFGLETSLRFLSSMQSWIRENTAGVLIIQIRDRPAGGWDSPFESEGISDHVTKPFLLLQHNWHKMMLYSQNDLLSFYATNTGYPVYKVSFQYHSQNEENKAALNFHLTAREKRDIALSLDAADNAPGFRFVDSLLRRQNPVITGR